MPIKLQAQINNDCINVFLANRLLCGNASFTQDNSNGFGANDFAAPNQNNPGCLLPNNGRPEVQSAWYAFKIQTAGTLSLDIIPNGASDFDFAIFGPDKPCHALGSPLRCSYASPQAPTGMNLTTGEVSENASGDGYVRFLDVLPGQTYYMLINNWSGNNNGFSLNWGGTGKLAVSTAEFNATVSCNIATFNGNGSVTCDGSVLGFEWDFGDGSPITSENFKKSPRHYYQATGIYQVKLTTTILESTAELNIGVKAIAIKPVTIVKVPPVIQMPNLQNKYCVSDPNLTLAATPVGGKFAIKKNQLGEFVDNQTVFSPPTLGVGKHEVRYTYQDPTDLACQSVKIAVVTVYALPTLDLNAISSTYCVSSPAFTLVGSPAGGTFKIGTTPATQFNPATLGAGTFTLNYDYADGVSGCAASTSKIVTIYPTPTLAYTNLRDAYCLAGSPFTIQATPAGGAMTINGASSANFDIPALGIGNHTVVYSYTSPDGCSNTLTKQVQIADKPIITFVGLNSLYCTDITCKLLLQAVFSKLIMWWLRPLTQAWQGQAIILLNIPIQTLQTRLASMQKRKALK